MKNNILFSGPSVSWRSAPRPDGAWDECVEWNVMPHQTASCFLLERHNSGCKCGSCAANAYHGVSLSTPICKAPNAWIWLFFRRKSGMWYLRWTRGSGLKEFHWWFLGLIIGRRMAGRIELFFWRRKCLVDKRRDVGMAGGKILELPR